MNKTKVFYLSTSLNVGGTEKFLVTLIENLGSDYVFSVGYLKEKGSIGDYLEKKGIEVKKLTAFGLIGHLRELKPAIVHTFLYRANIVGRIAARIAGVPIIISTQQAIDAWKNTFFVLLDKWSAHFCDVIIANSKTTKEVLVNREGIRSNLIEVVYNGIDPIKFSAKSDREAVRNSLGIAQDVPVILCVSRLHVEKGADLLADIASRVNNAVFIIAGDGPERRNIENKLASLKLENRCKLLGERHDIPDLLNASDIFLLPSREESFPQVILEAMLFSKPVVAADIGGVKELVEDKKTGLLVKPLDLFNFAESLNNLISNKELAKNMGAKAKERSKEFSESKMIDSIKSIYKRTLKNK